MEQENNELPNSRKKLQDDIKDAVQTDHNIRETVRQLTLKALTEGKLDINEIRQVVSAVVKGAGLGAADSATGGKEKLAKALSGLDDALSSTAEASKLALEEAAWNFKAFTKQDFKQATDDLMALEEIYLDTLIHVAKDSNEFIRTILNDLAQHAVNSGTAVGQRSTEIVKTLNRELGQTLSDTVITGSDSALKVASQISYAAAGFLDGIAQTLEAKLKNKPSKNNK